MSLARAVFGFVFFLGVVLQIIWWGVPIGEAAASPTIENMLDPLMGTIWGFVTYIVRALIPATIAAFAVRFLGY